MTQWATQEVCHITAYLRWTIIIPVCVPEYARSPPFIEICTADSVEWLPTLSWRRFRFDELEKHLNSYDAPKVVTVGEDATRLVKRVDYDSETDRLVGFVLPCDARGLPHHDSFIAVSFEAMKEAFQSANVANNAFVYMAQSLRDGVPAFCLACIGTDNKFSADLLLNRWTYIVSECKKRGIAVASFGADGD